MVLQLVKQEVEVLEDITVQRYYNANISDSKPTSTPLLSHINSAMVVN